MGALWSWRESRTHLKNLCSIQRPRVRLDRRAVHRCSHIISAVAIALAHHAGEAVWLGCAHASSVNAVYGAALYPVWNEKYSKMGWCTLNYINTKLQFYMDDFTGENMDCARMYCTGDACPVSLLISIDQTRDLSQVTAKVDASRQ